MSPILLSAESYALLIEVSHRSPGGRRYEDLGWAGGLRKSGCTNSDGKCGGRNDFYHIYISLMIAERPCQQPSSFLSG